MELRTLLPDRGYIVLMAQRGDRREFVTVEAGQWATLEQKINAAKDKANLYLSRASLTARPEAGKRGTSDLCGWQKVVTVDLDYGSAGHNREGYPPDRDAALALLEKLPSPSAILSTGNGLLVFWVLDQTHPIDAVEKVQKGIQRELEAVAALRGYVVDDTSERVRMFRVPGTLNHKSDPPKPVEWLFTDGPIYSLSDLSTYALEILPALRLSSGQLSEETVRELLRHIPREGLDYNRWLAAVWAVQSLFDEQTAERLLDEWGTPNWRKHKKPEGKETSPAILIALAKEYGFAGSVRSEGFDAVPIAPELPNTLTVEQRYLDVPMPSERVVVLKSAIGTGKTELIRRWLAEHYPKQPVLAVSHRVSLVKQMAQRLGLESYFSEGEWNVDAKRLAVTLHSVDKVSPKITYKVVVIDEVEQFLQALVFDRNLSSRKLSVFIHLLSRLAAAEKIILADADAGPLTLRFLTALGGPVRSIVNTYRHCTYELVYLAPTPEEVLNQARRLCAEGYKVAIACNTKADVERAEIFFKAELPAKRLLAVTADGREGNTDVLANLNERLETVDIFLFSPSVGTGVSIERNDFVLFGIARSALEGVGNSLDFAQQLGRFRNPIGKTAFCWVDPKTFKNVATDAEHYRDLALIRKSAADLRFAPDGQSLVPLAGFDALYTDLFAIAKAKDALLKRSFLNSLAGIWNSSEIAAVPAKGVKEALTREAALNIRKVINGSRREKVEAEIAAIANAPNTEAEAKAVDQLEYYAQKEEIAERYGCAIEEVTAELVKADRNGAYQKAQRLYALVNAEYAQWKDQQERIEKPTADLRLFGPFTEWLLAILTVFGIELREGAPVRATPEGIAFLKTYRAAIEALLGVRVRSDVDTAPIRTLSAVLATVGIRVVGVQRREGTTRVREYRLTGVEEAFKRTRGITKRFEVAKSLQAQLCHRSSQYIMSIRSPVTEGSPTGAALIEWKGER